ncbi:hypothetical protein LX32DRAFT_600204 [Colletotrichum zoysiae]|uniref:PD-(D/E)XK nuclease-like domain-containing protein n=1 Tax=Colletotrichum zoysiae TaxID=1216348 RepID=A0AAD9LVK7_9PEZI|nr:hypothetical protein LX32DRAFT_600204 [Colletotrichum zoysiae]
MTDDHPNDATTPSPKPKRYRPDSEHDADQTPRGPHASNLLPFPVSDDSSIPPAPPSRRPHRRYGTGSSVVTSSSVTSASAQSDTALSYQSSPSKTRKRRRQSSPRKQQRLMVMEMAVETATFGGPDDPPEALDVLVSRIEDFSRGDAILSPTLKEPMNAEQRANRRQFKWVTDRSFAPILSKSASPSRPDREELGPSPSISKAKSLWSAADDCYKFQHFESQWNHVVHSRILRAAFKHSSLIDFCSITGAAIHKDYTRTETPSHFNRKVDFCDFVNVETPELRATALGSPFHSVNHTEYPALLHRPIAMSIETKVPGDDWADAVNQLSAWLVAQWDVLDDLVLRAGDGDAPLLPAKPSSSAGLGTDNNDRRPRPSAAAAAGLSFLPGIIVQGHEWYFIAVTRAAADGHTQRWEKVLIGSTQWMEGVYKIVAVLQLLGHWVEHEFWPWFQLAVLRLQGAN